MSPRRRIVVAVASTAIACAQAPLFDLRGSTFNEGFGAGACALNDVDGDLVPDFAVSSSAGGAPTVAVRSGFDGHEMWSVTLPFGSGGTIVSPGDVNGDGASDIAAAARPSASSDYGVYVLSGLDGSVLWTFFRGFIESHEAVDAGRDYDGDGVGDVAVDFAPPVATPLGSGCVFHLDLAHAASWWLVPVATDAAGAFAFPVGVPAIPLLAGFPVTLQVFLFGTAGPLGFDLSNGVAATLGF